MAHRSNPRITRIFWVIVLLSIGLACQVTSPKPASWSGTPTAEAQKTALALTQNIYSEVSFVYTPTLEATPLPSATAALSLTSTPSTHKTRGPWLIYPASNGKAILAHEVDSGEIIEISLPEPIIFSDLLTGISSDGHSLIIRAGSVMNAEEFALYQIDIPTFKATRLTALMSISLQRQIVNQESDKALDTLSHLTRPDSLSWSPDGRFLAFNAALDNDNADLYVFDNLNKQIKRVNFLLTQNASPTWDPTGKWLISQELDNDQPNNEVRRAKLVTGLIAPNFILVDRLYQPAAESQEEVFVGWLNENIFISYSLTQTGAKNLRNVHLQNLQENLIFETSFQEVAFDPSTKSLVFILTYDQAIPQGLNGGIYHFSFEDNTQKIVQEGQWHQLFWDQAGYFVATGEAGVLIFTPDGDSILLAGQNNACLSPDGTWVIAWNNALIDEPAAQLYQSGSNAPLQTLITDHVENVLWQPDSKGFFIRSQNKFYNYVFPSLKAKQVSSNLPEGAFVPIIWVD